VSEVFWTSVATGAGLESGTPSHLLNRRMMNDARSVAKLDKWTVSALAIKAWNAHSTKSEIKTLKISSNEDFPRIK
jgi:hypothetical protein